MRGWLPGVFIAAVIAACTITASYATLNHFYGTRETEIIWKDVAPMAWENAKQAKPAVLTWGNIELVGISVGMDNLDLFGSSYVVPWAYGYAVLTCDDIERVRYVTLLEWENAENSKPPVLTVSPGFYMNYGGVEGADGAEDNYAWRSSYDETLGEALPGAGPGTFIVRETKSIAALPISASIGVAIGFMVFAVWIGYKRMWGDAASTLLEQGLHNMTVRDVEIVGQIMDLKEFTIPELVRRTHISKITVWRAVQKLIGRGLVEPTERTKLAANGLGGRGKPSRVYKYIGARASETLTKR